MVFDILMKDLKPILLIFLALLFSLAEVVAASETSCQTTEGFVAISATSSFTNTLSEAAISIGPTNFTGLDQVLSAYANLAGRTILRSTNLPAHAVNLWIENPLRRQAALQAFDAVLGLNGIAMISFGDKWIKVDSVSDYCGSSRHVEDKPVESYVTHVLQLSNTKPSELSLVLKPIVRAKPECIFAFDHNQMLVIRDYPENIKRMLDMIRMIDAPPRSEFYSEVIPIKYALASAVAAALYSRTADSDNPRKIIPDERSNSLLIFATPQDMKPIKDLVAQLDLAQAQVLIEATIIRVSQKVPKPSRMNRIEESDLQPDNDASVIGATIHANRLSVTNFVVTAATNAAAGQIGGFRYAARLDTDLDTMIKTSETNIDFRILQRPRIQTLHNEPATLFVGPPRPYPTGGSYTGAYGSYSTIAQLQLGLTLEVTPLINADGLAVMEIRQKTDRYAGDAYVKGVGDVPITCSIESQTTIAVRDRETILLGGLAELETVRSSGVPILKHIPLLGIPFRGTSHRTRNEFIALIRPTVLPNPKVAASPGTTRYPPALIMVLVGKMNCTPLVICHPDRLTFVGPGLYSSNHSSSTFVELG